MAYFRLLTRNNSDVSRKKGLPHCARPQIEKSLWMPLLERLGLVGCTPMQSHEEKRMFTMDLVFRCCESVPTMVKVSGATAQSLAVGMPCKTPAGVMENPEFAGSPSTPYCTVWVLK